MYQKYFVRRFIAQSNHHVRTEKIREKNSWQLTSYCAQAFTCRFGTHFLSLLSLIICRMYTLCHIVSYKHYFVFNKKRRIKIGIKSSFHSQLNNIGYSFFCSSQSVAKFSGSITANWFFCQRSTYSCTNTRILLQ